MPGGSKGWDAGWGEMYQPSQLEGRIISGGVSEKVSI
jgi:hypothetical protein